MVSSTSHVSGLRQAKAARAAKTPRSAKISTRSKISVSNSANHSSPRPPPISKRPRRSPIPRGKTSAAAPANSRSWRDSTRGGAAPAAVTGGDGKTSRIIFQSPFGKRRRVIVNTRVSAYPAAVVASHRPLSEAMSPAPASRRPVILRLLRVRQARPCSAAARSQPCMTVVPSTISSSGDRQ